MLLIFNCLLTAGTVLNVCMAMVACKLLVPIRVLQHKICRVGLSTSHETTQICVLEWWPESSTVSCCW